MSNNVITICRQYCSGGKEIGKALADTLGYGFYDNELITLAAKEAGYPESTFEKVDEVPTNSLLYSLVLGSYGANGVGAMPDNDKLFGIQSDIIRNAAKKESCVIIGRCADYVLREEERLIRVFLRADMDFRVERYKKTVESADTKNPEAVLRKTDKKRAAYHRFYSGEEWDDMMNYDIVINTAKTGIEGAVKLIKEYVEEFNKVKPK